MQNHWAHPRCQPRGLILASSFPMCKNKHPNLRLLWWHQAQVVSACNAGDPGSIPGSGRPLEKGMATHSSILAWRIPWTQESEVLHCPWGHKELDMTEWLTLGNCRTDYLFLWYYILNITSQNALSPKKMGSTETDKFQSCHKKNQCLEELRNVLIRKGEVRQRITKKKDSTWRVL